MWLIKPSIACYRMKLFFPLSTGCALSSHHWFLVLEILCSSHSVSETVCPQRRTSWSKDRENSQTYRKGLLPLLMVGYQYFKISLKRAILKFFPATNLKGATSCAISISYLNFYYPMPNREARVSRVPLYPLEGTLLAIPFWKWWQLFLL